MDRAGSSTRVPSMGRSLYVHAKVSNTTVCGGLDGYKWHSFVMLWRPGLCPTHCVGRYRQDDCQALLAWLPRSGLSGAKVQTRHYPPAFQASRVA